MKRRRLLPWLLALTFAVTTGCIPSCNVAHVRPERPTSAPPPPPPSRAPFRVAPVEESPPPALLPPAESSP